jgi:hypothetical protein
VIEIPIKDVSIATPHDKATRADFDFCQPNKLVVRPSFQGEQEFVARDSAGDVTPNDVDGSGS